MEKNRLEKSLIRILPVSIALILALSTVVNAPTSTPISGASVTASGDYGYGTTKTGLDGVFRITDGLGEGIYTVKVEAEKYISKVIENIEVKALKETDLGDIILEPSAVIRGVVETPQGKPAPSVPVALKDQDGNVVAFKAASSDGSFTFDTDVRNGTYSIEAYAFSFEGVDYQTVSIGFTQITIPIPRGGASYLEGYASGSVQGIKALQGERVEGVVVRLGLSGIISGRVTDLQDNPIPGIFVYAYQPEGRGLSGFFSITGKDGRYRIANNLATGDYNVTLLFPKGYVWSFMNAKRVHVEAGKETSNIDFKLERSGVISGLVLYSDNTPAANVSIVAGSMDGEYFGFTTSNVDGSFTIDSGLGTATYQVMAFAEAAFSMPVTVQVKAGEETKDVKLIIRATGRGMAIIEGRAVDERENPLEGVRITALGSSGETGKDGGYRLMVALPMGVNTTSTTVEASKPGYKPAYRGNVKVSVGETVKDVNFKLETIRLGVIKGRVLASAPAPPIKKTASLSLTLSPQTVKVGEQATISGRINPSLPGEVSILIASDTAFEEVAKVSLKDGGYTYSFSPPRAGSYRIKASWPGNPEYSPAESTVSTLTVEKFSPTISLSASKTSATVGETVKVSGSISPFKAATEVVIVVSSPTEKKEYSISSPDGKFEYNLKLEAKGTWRVKARIPESSTYTTAESSEIQITAEEVKAEEKRCIIATVTFGSEVAPEVNLLRAFRDGLILSTQAGRGFYVAFDAFYYSWSTPVANFIEENPILKPVVKALIYPLLGILKLTAWASSPIFGLSPELASVLAGLLASSLIGAIYVSPILLASSTLAEKRGRGLKPSIKTLKILWSSAVASLTMIGLGLFIGSSPLLVVSTSSYVLSVLASTSTSILYIYTMMKNKN
ncbi:carboxypeptidase regulatory-like domain-containing protein [Candidatus Bathyarchaeota archaeon]|nr:carboxypeptidase regulatory-like domain-containing protein [Candidatus Bathyarchaeota archaeon]